MIKKKSKLAVTLLIAVMAVIMPCTLFAKGWESIKQDRIEAKVVAKDQDIEIRAVNGQIIVTTNRAVHVKVFSILGHLISSETLPAGTSRLTVNAHGVYIVKTDDLTCKVAV